MQYKPQNFTNKLNGILKKTKTNSGATIEINGNSNIFILLWSGKLAKAWGFGGELRHHSKLLYALFNKPCKKSV